MSLDEGKSEILDVMTVREVVGVVDSADQLEKLVGRLLISGFDRADVDIMASRATALTKLDEAYVDPEQLADRPDVPRSSLVQRDDLAQTSSLAFGILTYIGGIGAALPIVASGGALAAGAAAAVAGGATAAAIGGIFSKLLKEQNAEKIREALQAGGLAVFVRVHSDKLEQRAVEIMSECGAQGVHAHDIDLEKRIEDIPLSRINPDPWLGDETLGSVD